MVQVMQPLELTLLSREAKVPFLVGENLLPALHEFLNKHFLTHTVYIIADQRVADIYGEHFSKALHGLPGYRGLLTFPAGESSKDREQKAILEDHLLGQKAGRDTLIVALGGGVAGDLAGYVAATLHRSVPLIHFPSSLLAQVDSSIGGKVGINHPAGKNLLGAFYQPKAVFCDLALLSTLPDEEYINGLAEVVKYGVISDRQLWNQLDEHVEAIKNREQNILLGIVRRCIELKINIVKKDEKESGLRSLLNWGHTVGHAIENISQYGVKHGFAIAAGMRVAARLSANLYGYPQELVNRQIATFRKYGLDTVSLKSFDTDQIWELIQSDKKSRQQTPHFTLLDKHSKPVLFAPIQKKEFVHAYSAEQTVS